MVNYLWENLFNKNQRDQEIERVLSQNYLFKTLSIFELSFLRELVDYRAYRPGEVIFSQGELGVGMYMIVKGSVNISVEDLSAKEGPAKNIFVTRLTRGDFFGEIALIEQDGRRTAAATAADEAGLIVFLKSDLAELSERNPRMGIKIVTRLAEVLARRLKEVADRFTEVKRELKELTKSNDN